MSQDSPSTRPACAEEGSRCVADHPFDIEAADIVFTTADDVDFRAYKNVLSLASPFFADMFSLAQPTETGVESIPIPESSKTFDYLLRLCYPVADPDIQDLSQLELVLEAATKYQMEEALNIARRMLRTFVQSKPLQTFVLACRFGAEEEAKLSASSWKQSYEWKAQQTQKKVVKGRKPSQSQEVLPDYHNFASTFIAASYIPEMTNLSAAIFYRLIYFGRVHLNPPPAFIQRDNSYPPPIPSKTTPYDEVVQWPIDVADADIVVRSVDGLEFPYHKLLLSLSGGNKLLDSGSRMDVGEGKPPVVQVGISGQALKDLLNVCLPSAGCELEDTYRLWRLSRVTIEYEMIPVTLAVKKQVQRKASTWPLSVYLISSQNGWKDEAASAAKLLTEQVHIEDIYDPILEDIPTSAYYSLLRYHHHSVAAMSKIIQKYTPTRVEWKGRYARYPDTWPMYVSMPVAAQELERQMQRSTPVKNQRTYDVSTLVSNSERMEKEIKEAQADIKLELPDDEGRKIASTALPGFPSPLTQHESAPK